MTLKNVVRRAIMTTFQVAIVVLLVFLWQYGADHHAINTFFFSKPSDIWDYLRLWSSSHQPADEATGTTLWQDLGATIIVFGLGYLIGTALGIVMGIVIGTVRIVREVTEPFIIFMNAVPRLILLPILVVIFGFGFLPQILLVILVIFFLVAVNIAAAVQEAPVNILNNARALGATKMNLVRSVYVPSLTIWVLSTSRLVIGYAIQASVAAEFIGAAKGLGYRFPDAQSKLHPNELFAALLVVLLLALVVDMALSVVEKRVTRWMPT